MTVRLITMAAIGVFLALTACTTIAPTIAPPTPAPTPTRSAPLLTEEEAIAIAYTHGQTLASVMGARCGGTADSTARYTEGKWIVALPSCTFIVDDQTGVVISR